MRKIIIATIKSWNITNALKFKDKNHNKYDVQLVTKKEELTLDFVKKFNPEYIFFPHWSWIIPEEIYQNYNCIVFHMTDLPFGRGGSPLQNLISGKTYNTKISAIKVEKQIDAGKIYLKEDFNVKSGSAEEIFIDASNVTFLKMIPSIIENPPVFTQQVGEPVYFK
ncbi:methionyl-tRNA formyltransferase, partial [bacterium]|nr:methionyl-tRNA formyltransferase [bacterium]